MLKCDPTRQGPPVNGNNDYANHSNNCVSEREKKFILNFFSTDISDFALNMYTLGSPKGADSTDPTTLGENLQVRGSEKSFVDLDESNL